MSRYDSASMSRDLVSKKTRQAFREYFVGTTLGTIADAFEAEDIQCDRDYAPPVGGQRRSLVEQYYHSVNWEDPSDVAKVLRVFEGDLNNLERATSHEAKDYRERLFSCLKRDAIRYEDGRLWLPVSTVHTAYASNAASRLDLPGLQLQIDRITRSINSDPSHAVGTAKEMIETTCKSILTARGETYSRSEDIPDLLKRTRKVLKLLPEDIPDSARGADTIRRLLTQLASIAQNVAELRGLYGTGHGKDGKAKGLLPRHARLVVGAAAALVTFLLETHEAR